MEQTEILGRELVEAGEGPLISVGFLRQWNPCSAKRRVKDVRRVLRPRPPAPRKACVEPLRYEEGFTLRGWGLLQGANGRPSCTDCDLQWIAVRTDPRRWSKALGDTLDYVLFLLRHVEEGLDQRLLDVVRAMRAGTPVSSEQLERVAEVSSELMERMQAFREQRGPNVPWEVDNTLDAIAHAARASHRAWSDTPEDRKEVDTSTYSCMMVLDCIADYFNDKAIPRKFFLDRWDFHWNPSLNQRPGAWLAHLAPTPIIRGSSAPEGTGKTAQRELSVWAFSTKGDLLRVECRVTDHPVLLPGQETGTVHRVVNHVAIYGCGINQYVADTISSAQQAFKLIRFDYEVSDLIAKCLNALEDLVYNGAPHGHRVRVHPGLGPVETQRSDPPQSWSSTHREEVPVYAEGLKVGFVSGVQYTSNGCALVTLVVHNSGAVHSLQREGCKSVMIRDYVPVMQAPAPGKVEGV